MYLDGKGRPECHNLLYCEYPAPAQCLGRKKALR